jgi:hypothetical protein
MSHLRTKREITILITHFVMFFFTESNQRRESKNPEMTTDNLLYRLIQVLKKDPLNPPGILLNTYKV